MSYPEPRYHGENGEVTAVLRPAGQDPELSMGGATSLGFLATGASTGGRFGLYRWASPAKTPGARPHFHRTMSESFFVLSGTMTLFDGERWIEASAGDFLFVPEGGIHGFGNVSDEPASMLILFAPGAPREPSFEAIARRASGRTFTPEEWTEICVRHDNHFIE